MVRIHGAASLGGRVGGGRRELGSIQASVYVTAQLASAGGAVALGFAKDYFGSFAPLFLGFVAVELALVALFVARALRGPTWYRNALGLMIRGWDW